MMFSLSVIACILYLYLLYCIMPFLFIFCCIIIHLINKNEVVEYVGVCLSKEFRHIANYIVIPS